MTSASPSSEPASRANPSAAPRWAAYLPYGLGGVAAFALLLLLAALLLLFGPPSVSASLADSAEERFELALRLLALAVAGGALVAFTLLLLPSANRVVEPESAASAVQPEILTQEANGAAAPRDALEALSRASIFQRAQAETIAALAERAEPRRYRAGELIFIQGDQGDEALVIADGSVDVLTVTRHRREVPLATLSAGSCVGEIAAMLSGRTRSATVRAREDVMAYALSSAVLRAASRADSALAAQMGARMERLGVDSFLKLASPFVQLNVETVWEIAGRMRRRAVAAAETVVRQGEAGDTFYLVTSGRMEVIREDDTPLGRHAERQVVQLGPGDCFGEAALLTDKPRSATVRALEPAEVLELNRDDFEQVVAQHESARAFFAELFFARYRFAPKALLAAATDPITTLMPRLQPSQTRRVVAWFLGGLFLLALLSAASIGIESPLLTYPTLLLGGLLPATAFVAYIRERDLLRDLPLRSLLAVGILAAGLSVPLAIWLQTQLTPTSVILSALLVAVIEEPLKLVGVLWVIRRQNYRFQFDGVIFGITAAMGFGGLESLGYGLLALRNAPAMCGIFDGEACMVQTLWLRIAAAFFGHGPWTAMVCAVLFRERGRASTVLTRPVLFTFGLAVLLHTLWDVNPVVFGIPVAMVGIVTLRRLMQEGLSHQASALVHLSQLRPGDPGGDPEYQVVCVRCSIRFPSSAIYCVRCGLSLA